jgi:hypothetical protein
MRLPAEISGELELDPREKVKLQEAENDNPAFRKYIVPGGEKVMLKLKFT